MRFANVVLPYFLFGKQLLTFFDFYILLGSDLGVVR